MLMRRLLCAMLLLAPLSISAEVLELRYPDFTIWLDCEKRAATKFHYTLGRDGSDLKRTGRNALDPNEDKNCQQSSTSSYKYPELDTCELPEHEKRCFHKGHLVPYTHMDHSSVSARQTNYMTNILPQARNLNIGAWQRTEEITECYRDYSTLEIYGGPVWGKGIHLAHHSIALPDYYWKVIIRDDKAIAWIIPNSNEEDVAKDDLSNYLVTIESIEKATGQSVPVEQNLKKDVADDSNWSIDYCDQHSPQGWRR